MVSPCFLFPLLCGSCRTGQGTADIRSSFDVPQLAAPEAGKEIAIRYLCRFLPQLNADSEMQHAVTTMGVSMAGQQYRPEAECLTQPPTERASSSFSNPSASPAPDLHG